METDPGIQEDGAPERKNSSRSLRFPAVVSFNPEDVDLLVNYLNCKIEGQPLPYDIMHDVKLYDHSPDELFEMYGGSGKKRLYFFTPRYRKYRNGSRPNRAAGGGFWKATGSEKKILKDGQQVGAKKTLVYYKGKAKATNGEKSQKTVWTMEEYVSKLPNLTIREPGDSMKLDDWVLCRLHKKRGTKLSQVSRAQSDMPGNAERYQTFIDRNGDYSNAFMAQPLAASPSGLMTDFNGMVQPSAAAPRKQMIDSNRMMRPLAMAYGEPMANFSSTAQKAAISPAPSEQMIDYDRMMQPPIVGYDEPMASFSCTVQNTAIFPTPSEQMIDYNLMMQPLAMDYGEPIANLSCTAPNTAISPAPSEQMIDYNRMMQPLAMDYGVPMADFSCTAQNIAISPAGPMTNFNGTARPFAAAPVAQMTGFDNTKPSMSATFHNGMPRTLAGVVLDESIADCSAVGQPSPSSPMMELNGIVSINNNYSTGQDFQHNLSHEMLCSQHLVDTFGMGFDETDEVTAPRSTYPSMEGPSNQKSWMLTKIANNGAGSKHAEDFTKLDP